MSFFTNFIMYYFSFILTFHCEINIQEVGKECTAIFHVLFTQFLPIMTVSVTVVPYQKQEINIGTIYRVCSDLTILHALLSLHALYVGGSSVEFHLVYIFVSTTTIKISNSSIPRRILLVALL